MAAFAHEDKVVAATATSLTSSVYNPAGKYAGSASIYVDGTSGDEVRWDIGRVPTSAIGMVAPVGSYITLEGDEVADFKAIEKGTPAGTITMRVRYKFWE